MKEIAYRELPVFVSRLYFYNNDILLLQANKIIKAFLKDLMCSLDMFTVLWVISG